MARYTPSLPPRTAIQPVYSGAASDRARAHHQWRPDPLSAPALLAQPPTPRNYGVLTTTGRKTGKRRRKCIRAIRRADSVYIVSIGGPDILWLKNLDANPNVTLRIRGGTFAGRARKLTDPLETEQAREAYCEPVDYFDYMACMNWRKGRPTRPRIKDLTRGWFEEGVPLVVELHDQARAT